MAAHLAELPIRGRMIFNWTLFIADLRPERRDHPPGNSSGLMQQNFMSTKLYVGNLPFDVTEDDLRNKLSTDAGCVELF